MVVAMTGDTFACVVGEPIGEFGATVQNGSGTISYKWYEDGVLRGTSSTYTLYNLSVGTRRVEVVVTRGGESDADVRFVDVINDPEGNQCWL